MENSNLFAFEIGNNKKLCHAELVEKLGEKNFVDKNYDISIFSLSRKIDMQSLQNALGGTIKIIEILYTLNEQDSSQNLFQKVSNLIPDILSEHFKDYEAQGKVPFSISSYGYNNYKSINIKRLLNISKKFLKSLDLNCRFVNLGPENPKPSTIYKAMIVEKGIDICIIKGEKHTYVGRAITIQDIDSYTIRDYLKPGRDAYNGMLPPKLGQILINLAGNNTKTIYDPFCGTGTILMEGLLMGKKVIGSDVDARMIDLSNKNLAYLREKFDIKNDSETFRDDIRLMNPEDLKEYKIDCIVTESYLGKPISRVPTREQQESLSLEIMTLHRNWLKTAAQILQRKSRLILCLPAIKNIRVTEHIKFFDEMAVKNGFKVIATYNYSRPDQLISRDIKILEKA